eukprot:2861234-Pyramimonas_sp.AAC.1
MSTWSARRKFPGARQRMRSVARGCAKGGSPPWQPPPHTTGTPSALATVSATVSADGSRSGFMLSTLPRLAPAPGLCSLPSHDWLPLR